MQARQKWRSETANLSVGDVVLIIDPQRVRASWPVAKILPGDDGRVRAVKVQTKDQIYTRPVARFIKLPADPDEDESPEVAMNVVEK